MEGMLQGEEKIFVFCFLKMGVFYSPGWAFTGCVAEVVFAFSVLGL